MTIVSSARPCCVEVVEDLPDELVVVAHHVVVLRLPPAGLAAAAVLDVGAEVHVRRVEPHEERGVAVLGGAHEAQRLGEDLLVDGLHPLAGERAGVLDALRSVTVGPRVDHAAGSEALAEVRELRVARVVVLLGFLLGVEVVEVAEELVEAMHRREELVLVAEMVLAELAGGVPLRLEGGGDRRVRGPQADVGARESDLGEAGPVRVLAGDERRPAGRAALLAVVVGEAHAFGGDAVDVGSAVPHQTVAVAAEVGDPDVVSPDDQDVGLAIGHDDLLDSQSVGTKSSRRTPRGDQSWACCTSTGQTAWRTTWSDVEPITARRRPLRPWVPSTTTLAGSAAATSQITCPASPYSHHRLDVGESEFGHGLVERLLRCFTLGLDQVVLLVERHDPAGEPGPVTSVGSTGGATVNSTVRPGVASNARPCRIAVSARSEPSVHSRTVDGSCGWSRWTHGLDSRTMLGCRHADQRRSARVGP